MKKMMIALFIAPILVPFTFLCANSRGLHNSVFIPQVPQLRSISIRGTLSNGVMTDAKIEPFEKIYTDRFVHIWWENYSDTPINIKFGNGDNCKKISSLDKIRFWRLSHECYITKKPIAQKGAFRLWVDESGTYEFEIQFVGTNSTKKGVLIVF